MKEVTILQQTIEGCLLGLMLGDTVGLPYEGISARRITKLARGNFCQSLLFGKGMVSDDTEHAVITARSLCVSESTSEFGESLAWGLRWWFLRLPAGIGMATGRALIKSCLGFSYNKSGVYSAGNGPAMRAPVLGVVFGHNPELLKQYISIATRITHTDTKAYIGSLAVAQASYLSAQHNYSLSDFKSAMHSLLMDLEDEQTEAFWKLIILIEKELSNDDKGLNRLLKSLKQDKEVSGYIYHTVPVVLFLFFRHKSDFKVGISQIISCGGDTDTTAAILGGIMGSGLRKDEFPELWVHHIKDYPCNPSQVEALAEDLNQRCKTNKRVACRWLPGPLILIRNVFFLAIVLVHGFRRLLPPY